MFVFFTLIWNAIVTFIVLYITFLPRMWPLAVTLILFVPPTLVVLDTWASNYDKHMVPQVHQEGLRHRQNSAQQP